MTIRVFYFLTFLSKPIFAFNLDHHRVFEGIKKQDIIKFAFADFQRQKSCCLKLPNMPGQDENLTLGISGQPNLPTELRGLVGSSM